MYTKEDLIARLQNGEDVDTIAQEMATALNAAQAAVEEEAKRAEKDVDVIDYSYTVRLINNGE